MIMGNVTAGDAKTNTRGTVPKSVSAYIGKVVTKASA
jgi:hypothetical protein